MERNRVYVLLAWSLLAVSLALSGGPGAAESAEQPQKRGVMRVPPPPLPCPPGWHHVNYPDILGACGPDRPPKPVECPPGYQWDGRGVPVGPRVYSCDIVGCTPIPSPEDIKPRRRLEDQPTK